MEFNLFIDETGDHGLTFIDKNFPLFLLCGCVISKENLQLLENKVNKFKYKFFKTTDVILHSREIRKCEGSFQILFNLDLKKEFYEDLNKVISQGNFYIIGSGINKEEHIKRYGKGAINPYSLSLSFILERVIFFLDNISKSSRVRIFVEERGRRENTQLVSHFNSILDRGTYYVPSERFKSKIRSFDFYSKRDNIIGLQVADLCAYPLARHILNPKEPYIPFKIIENKIYCNKKGKYHGWGLKIFP